MDPTSALEIYKTFERVTNKHIGRIYSAGIDWEKHTIKANGVETEVMLPYLLVDFK